MAKIKRSSGKGVRRAAKSQSRAAGARRAKAASTIWLTLIIGAAVGIGFVIANLAGVPALAQAQVAAMASDAGFEVKHVRVTGTSRMDERQVYARALAQRDRPMPLVELDALRAELRELPWVKDARVSVQLPSTLAIDIDGDLVHPADRPGGALDRQRRGRAGAGRARRGWRQTAHFRSRFGQAGCLARPASRRRARTRAAG